MGTAHVCCSQEECCNNGEGASATVIAAPSTADERVKPVKGQGDEPYVEEIAVSPLKPTVGEIKKQAEQARQEEEAKRRQLQAQAASEEDKWSKFEAAVLNPSKRLGDHSQLHRGGREQAPMGGQQIRGERVPSKNQEFAR
eukprot:gnl/TRDRNA2_/TRDRNA2_87648_c0_seq1.p1 gnl/TRDRNA2_/TRDRNA2_87648_c0~~gnl/TRDRNA2_/TRDRNA2_87648_c0_seq1.p1  ORF type:complete len:141 (+),score=30.41 gnl/TRDRNA2_/TRDRNA2_87648_c0_seq1:152-574(+)